MRQVRYGLLGASQIARKAHLNGLRHAENSILVGIASRSPAKARAWAQELNIPQAFDSYEAMLADPGIDAVLITLPMTEHCEWIGRAARAGKHVLCEKPMSLTVAEAEAVIQVAQDCGVIIMEAFSHRFPGHLAHVKDMLTRGEIGDIKVIHAEVVYRTVDWAADSRAQPELGACVTVEAGCYCADTIRYLMHDDPDEVGGFATQRKRNGVDTSFVGIMRFPGNRLATMCTSMETKFRARVEILGSEGRIEIPSLFQGGEIRVSRLVEPVDEVITMPCEDRFITQIRHFSDCVLHGTRPMISLEDSRGTTALLSRLRGVDTREH